MNASSTTLAAHDDDTVTYQVLYYKRAHHHKVHQHKDVSKLDGLLVVRPVGTSGSCHVVLKDANETTETESSEDDEEDPNLTWKQRRQQQQKRQKSSKPKGGVVFSGQVTSELLCQPSSTDDGIVSLGASWQVELLSRVDDDSTTKQAVDQPKRPPTALGSLQQRNRSVKPSLVGARKPILQPRQPLLQSRKKPLLTSRTNVASTKLKGPTPNVTQSTTLSRATTQKDRSTHPTAPKPTLGRPFRRPLLTSKKNPTAPAALNQKSGNTAASIASSSSAPTKQPPLKRLKTTLTTKATSTASANATAKSTATQSNNNNNDNKTALAHIPLPATLVPVFKPHQVQGVDFLWKALVGNADDATRGAILADEMGLGKTLMTIAIVAAMHRRQRSKQFVVVCPSSLVSNWSKEFDKWLGKASQPKRVVITKGGEQGLQQIRSYCNSMKHSLANQTGRVLILSYDLFRRNVKEFQSLNTSMGLLVADEAHRLKNTNGSLTLSALESLSSDARLCLTATPIQNNLSEFYNLVHFCKPGSLGDLASFRRNYERPINAAASSSASRQERVYGQRQSQELEAISKSFLLRRLQKDILKTMLPPRTEALLFCRPSDRQCELYRSLTTQNKSLLSPAIDALTTLTSLRKICSHPFLLHDKGDQAAAAVALSGKVLVLNALLQSIRDTAPNDKVVIVSNFTSALSVVESLVLKPNGHSYVRLDGTTDVQNRQPLVDSFNRSSVERTFCFLLSTKAGGCGLNLIGANRLILLDADWNPALDVQAMGRVYRQGQTKPCFIYRLFTSGTVEEVIYQRQSLKGNLATMTVDGDAGRHSKFTKEEIADCFELKENCNCATKRKVGSQWPDYDGPDSLRLDGCLDEPLLQVAETHSETLAFVHIVSDDEVVPLKKDQSVNDSVGDDYSSKSECEYVDDEVATSNQKQGNDSSAVDADEYSRERESEF